MIESKQDITLEGNVPSGMRDGVTLFADIYRPKGGLQSSGVAEAGPPDRPTYSAYRRPPLPLRMAAAMA
jgi:predicted acyl esterase